MERFCIIGGEINQYTKDNQEKIIINIQYFDPVDKQDGSQQRGFEIITRNIYPEFVLDDFEKMPGYYNFDMRQRKGFRGKSENYLRDFHFDKAFDIKPCPQSKEAYLVLGIKKISFQPEGTTRKIKGVQCYFLDPLEEEEENTKGYQVMKSFSSQVSMENFGEIPGYYDLKFSEKPGKYGIATSKLMEVKMIAPLINSNQQITQTAA